MPLYHGRGLGKFLIEEGLCPEQCRNVELHVPADGAVFLRYDVFVETKDISKLTRALTAMAADDPTKAQA